MNTADYLIIAVLILSVFLGFFRGFLHEAIGLISWLGGLWLAWKYAHVVEPYLGGLLDQQPLRAWVARAILLLGIVLLGWIIASIVAYFVHQSGLSMMLDRLLGVLFGFLRGAVIVALIVMLGRLVELDRVSWWKHSRLLPYATELSTWIKNFAESASDVGERHKSAAEA